ncbi:arabinogalactan peptide 20-like [Pyrus ussuriensis x Pyrus communis]|uniref:Arabinogalactan peptide 20-like n=1 Tax=Pyrus ussuriensis x Pyrus communis TaxID=2448454 RepID=A0A5N5GS47_9ROSA|nr:arabinogalactan peptide 20-like [Pyrus ussuriensis x Pyrus communis]
MEILKVEFFVMAVFALVISLLLPSINAQSLAPAPAPTSDGVAVDQGIAYGLMVLALLLTYIIH